ncbi:MAG: hypothetical protein P4L31_04595 [Candidatus Babeliales bacterium]|nr:hypothetical protein [Candidatus Babeliales bacterium]
MAYVTLTQWIRAANQYSVFDYMTWKKKTVEESCVQMVKCLHRSDRPETLDFVSSLQTSCAHPWIPFLKTYSPQINNVSYAQAIKIIQEAADKCTEHHQ